MMESETLLYKSPLFGRRSGQILLQPLKFYESWDFYPQKNFSDFLSIYTITGGMPSYLLQIDPKESIEKNIVEKVFQKTEFLYNEIEFILKEELREPKNYLSILKAISWGKSKFGEIVNDTGLEKNVLHKYLSTLECLQLIEKEVSVTEKNPQKSRKGLYKICDNFSRFWFQYVFPHRSNLEIGNFTEVLSKFRENFSILNAVVYEKVSQEILWKIQNKLFQFERMGRWWDKNIEIDIIAFNSQSRKILFGEVKWSEKQVGTNIYRDLKKKAESVVWNLDSRKEYFVIFSKSGFTKDMKKLAKNENVYLIQQDKLIYPK